MRVQNNEMQAMVDTGATINVLSSRVVKKKNLRTQTMDPIKLQQGITRRNVIVTEKLVSAIETKNEDNTWRRAKETEFIVADLRKHDAILGMPFLRNENVWVDATKGKIEFDDIKRLNKPNTELNTKLNTELNTELITELNTEPNIELNKEKKKIKELIRKKSGS